MALFVFSNFVINAGLVPLGVVEKFSIPYVLLYVPLVYLHVKTILVYFQLNRKLLGAEKPAVPHMAPAE